MRHGKARKVQQENQRGRVRAFQKHGIAKKMEKLSVAQLRTMFPDLMHLPENELRKQALNRLKDR